MTHLKVRHLVSKPNSDGSVRYYWQATNRIQKAGMATERLPDDFGSAIARAEELNSEWDLVRKLNIYQEDRDRIAKTIESAAGV